MLFFTILTRDNIKLYCVKDYQGRIINMEYSEWLTYQDTLNEANIYYTVAA